MVSISIKWICLQYHSAAAAAGSSVYVCLDFLEKIALCTRMCVEPGGDQLESCCHLSMTLTHLHDSTLLFQTILNPIRLIKSDHDFSRATDRCYIVARLLDLEARLRLARI